MARIQRIVSILCVILFSFMKYPVRLSYESQSHDENNDIDKVISSSDIKLLNTYSPQLSSVSDKIHASERLTVVSVKLSPENLSKSPIKVGHQVQEYHLIDKVYDLGVKQLFLSDDGLISGFDEFLLPIPLQSLCDYRAYDKEIVPMEVNHLINDLNPSKRSGSQTIDVQTQKLINSNVNISDDVKGLQKLEKVKVLHNNSCFGNGTYYMKDNIFHGGHGDVWRAYKLSSDGFINQTTTFILKRMNSSRPFIAECAAREIYFGKYFQSYNIPVTNLITYFKEDDNYWLVFRDEGISLQKLLYVTSLSSNTTTMVQSSTLWKKLRTTTSGNNLLKGLIHHLISATAQLHDLGITHRDLKPNNILINTETEVKLLIGDFSSAINEDILLEGAYGIDGPSIHEETLDYAPPEVLMSVGSSDESPYDVDYPESYDIWSIGVIFLEIILGTASVFSIDQRTASLLARKLKSKHNTDKNKDRYEYISTLLAAWSDYCIYNPILDSTTINSIDDIHRDSEIRSEKNHQRYTSDDYLPLPQSFIPYGHSKKSDIDIDSHSHSHNDMNTNKCDIEKLQHAILKRDPLGLGFHDKWGLDLLQRLLKFDSKSRISLKKALQHGYFVGPYRSSLDNSEHATEEDLAAHDFLLSSSKKTCVDDDNICINIFDSSRKVLQSSESESESTSFTTTTSSSSTTTTAGYLASPISSISSENLKYLKKLLPFTSSNRSLFDIKESIVFESETTQTELPYDSVDQLEFICPTCGRKFRGDYHACHSHLIIRNHGNQCLYNRSTLPNCLSDHSMLPLDPHSGWCDLQGRRRYIEDYHSIAFAEGYKYFGVFDGHFGSRTARFLSKRLHNTIDAALFHHRSDTKQDVNGSKDDDDDEMMARTTTKTTERLINELNRFSHWKSLFSIAKSNESLVIDNVIENQNGYETSSESSNRITVDMMKEAIISSFLSSDSELYYSNQDDNSGSTVSIVLVFQNHVVVSHVGDSRVVLCCDHQGQAVQLTIDHIPYSHSERIHIYERGGDVIGNVSNGESLRVNGKLAVTRSIGDNSFENIISPYPDILVLNLREGLESSSSSNLSTTFSSKSPCVKYMMTMENMILNDDNKNHPPHSQNKKKKQQQQQQQQPLFIIMASDGLWDVLSNQEACDLMCNFILRRMEEYESISNIGRYIHSVPIDTMNEAAKFLAQEAFVRGSTDNIGVATIDLLVS